MKHLRDLPGACLSAALLASCGGSNGLSSSTPVAPQIESPMIQSSAGLTAERTHVRPAYSMLYSFKGGTEDGRYPGAALVNVGGTLYGTTRSGGDKACSRHQGCGTVFAITTSGKETVFYSFKGERDGGKWPVTSLIDLNGTLYGTTQYGGAGSCKYVVGISGCGTVFAITTSGKETVLHSFGGSGDGTYPLGGLIDVHGTLYGTTVGGGAYCSASGGCGTVFMITTFGKETVLHSFGGSGDGTYPLAGLINVHGTLYGTTQYGGGSGCPSLGGCGTVFAITTSGKETVLYGFKGEPDDGSEPAARLLTVNGTLYGTTYGGGAYCAGGPCGTAFAVTTSGKETVLHSFAGTGDGVGPLAGLINVHRALYGTTLLGGANGLGTVFTITTSGAETVLHSFKGHPDDGKWPQAALLNVKGTLYGTTEFGGVGTRGTVFSLMP
ncbi:MAG: choice-of-anchor tandem repeat GloVer-containing protein [Candidatus Cybelea sp.]